ncbi:XRE family transcriptional regulator [Actinophytocola sp.]|uniref:nSTAND1 domain-containing NTPase n=1 Tax=Actinophytocola sp. TaxID=1872138 RepID=UPI002ED9304B
MPRGERPLGPGDDVLVRFAGDLRRLRERAGSPTYRELAARAHYSAAALSEAAGGRKLPSLAVTVAYVAACGGDTAEWETRWREAAADLADEPVEQAGGEPPYVGLAAFQPADADLFFGRERLVAELESRARESRFLGVFGPSGYGKSSVIRAGLVARLGSAPVVVLTPGAHPLEECAVRIGACIGESAAVLRAEFAADPANLHLRVSQAMVDRGDLVLVVDQFEEIFTLCRDEGERVWLIRALVTAATADHSRTRVVLGVRADFYGHCARHPDLVTALRDNQVLVGPLDEDELRDVVVKPAELTGLRVETALVARIIANTAGAPGALPLLSHVLLETWRRRRGTTLTLAGYEAAGGLRHALSRTAEDTVAALEPRQQGVAKQVFLRLCALGDGTDDAKRRVRREELADLPGAADVLDRLARARLVTLDRDNVELAHEALIRHWPRLREWLTEDREGLRTHRQLTEAAQAWESLHRDAGALYRGARLARAQDWSAGGGFTLSPLEREFLYASRSAQEAEHAAEQLRTRRYRRLVALLMALLVIATATTIYAVRAQRVAGEQRNASIAQSVITQATVLSRTDPALAAQLALSAFRLAPTPDNRDSLMRIVAATSERQADFVAFTPGGRVWGLRVGDTALTIKDVTENESELDGPAPAGQPLTAVATTTEGDTVSRASVDAMGFSPDARTVAVITDLRRIQAWDVDALPSTEPLASFDAPPGACVPSCSGLAVHPNGRILAASSNRQVTLWQVGPPDGARELGSIGKSGGGFRAVAFSPDGNLLATAHDDGHIVLWDVRSPQTPVRLGVVATGMATYAVYGSWIAFSPDSRLIVTPGRENRTEVFDIADPRRPRAVGTLGGHDRPVSAVALSPDGHRLATASADHTTGLWDLTEPRAPRRIGTLSADLGIPHRVWFAPDGHTVATGGQGTLLLWETDINRLTTSVCMSYRPIPPDRWDRYFPGIDYRDPCPR